MDFILNGMRPPGKAPALPKAADNIFPYKGIKKPPCNPSVKDGCKEVLKALTRRDRYNVLYQIRPLHFCWS